MFLGDFGAPGFQVIKALLRLVVKVGRRSALARWLGELRLPAFLRCDGRHSQQQLHFALEHRAGAIGQGQGHVIAFGDDMAERDQLPQHGAPLLFRQVGADRPGAQRLVAILRHLVGQLAAQHIDQMAGAETLPAVLVKAVNATEYLARSIGRVPGGRRKQAVVAIPAVAAGLAEIAKQAHAPAVGRLGQGQQGVELAPLTLLELLFSRAFVDHAALVDDIGKAIGHPGVSGSAIAAGTAGFLVIALDVLGQIQMRDEAHIGLVDAHAEGDRRHHHDAVFAQKTVLVPLAQRRIQAGVIGQRLDALGFEPGCGFLNLLAALAVDDAGVIAMFILDEAQQLFARLVFFNDRIADIGPVEGRNEQLRFFELEPLDDVGAGQVVGSRGQRDPRHIGVALMQQAQGQVFATEVMPPLADAMRFVDRKQAQQAAFMQRVELRQKARIGDALGSGIKHHQAAAHHLALDLAGLLAAQR